MPVVFQDLQQPDIQQPDIQQAEPHATNLTKASPVMSLTLTSPQESEIASAVDCLFDDDLEPALSSYPRCADGNGTLSFLFFSDDDLEMARAKAICRTCGLQESCLSGAIERQEPYGVWGGKLVLDGVPVEFKRRRGRPPKHAKPILIVDEAPIPPHLVA